MNSRKQSPKKGLRVCAKLLNPDEIKKFYEDHHHNITQTCKEFRIGHERLEKILSGMEIVRKRKTTKEEDQFIVNCESKNFVSAKEIAVMFFEHFKKRISHDTVTRRLHENGFSFVKPRTVQILTNDQILVRYHFSDTMLRYYRKSLPQIVFSDESRFCDGPDNSSHWRLKDDFSDRTTAAHSKHSESWMVWGAIGLNYKSPLYFYDGSIDKASYIKCLEDVNLFSSLDEKYGKGCYIFQQDGATCHTAKETMDFKFIIFSWLK